MATGPIVIKIFAENDEITAEDWNDILGTFAARFGQIQGADFIYPFIAQGNFNLGGNRIVQAREVMDILDLSAYGSDDEAFSTAVAELSGGGIILIPKNTTITCTRGLKIRQNRNRVYLLGSGPSSVIKMAADSDDDAIAVDGCYRFRISNLMIDGNRANNTAGHGIVLTDCEDFEVSNVWVGQDTSSGVASSGFVLTGCRNGSIKRSWVRNCGNDFVYMDRSTGIVISQMYGTHVGNPVKESTNRRGGWGIAVLDGCEDIGIDHCRMEDVYLEGIVLRSAKNVEVSGCSIIRSGLDGEWNQAAINIVGTAGQPMEGFNVSGCFCTEGLVGNYVRGNSAYNLLQYGSDNSFVTFKDNKAFNQAHHGTVSFGAGADTATITLGVTGLPIQAIVATWNWSGDPNTLRTSVLSAKYSGQTVYFYNANTVTGTALDAFYSIEV